MKLDIDDNSLYAIFWVSLFTFLISVTGGVYFAAKHTDELIAEMVRNGEDPIAASCSVHSNTAEPCKLREIDNLEKLLRHVATPNAK